MKKRIAFVKIGGAGSGGTEKYLQTIAANLDKNKFDVDYYYSSIPKIVGSKFVPLPLSQDRIKYLTSNNVNTIEFQVGKINLDKKYGVVLEDTNFYEIFNENSYDLIQIARSHKNEEPYIKIKKTPIFDSIHTYWGTDDQLNVKKVFIATKDLEKKWIEGGGIKNKIVTHCFPIDDKKDYVNNYRKKLNIEDKFVFGMHQRNDDALFSDIPLKCYSLIETSKTAFFIMGGSKKYSNQAKKLNLKNFIQIDFDSSLNSEEVFLNSLNVFAHGRKDGETFGLAIAEAMRNSLPIISHKNLYNNGHIETVGSGGKVVNGYRKYVLEMLKLWKINRYYLKKSTESRKIFVNNFDSKVQIKKFEKLYLEEIK